MNRNIMIQTLRRFKVTSGYKGYYYLLDAADIISGFHTKEKPFATQNDIYIPIGEKHETSFYNVERGIRVVIFLRKPVKEVSSLVSSYFL